MNQSPNNSTAPSNSANAENSAQLVTANKAAAATFFEEIWNKKSESAIDRLVAENAAGNDPKFGVGRESFKVQWRKWHAGFSDLHFHVEEIIAEGERVVTRWRLTGTHDGEFLGQQPTGRKVDVDGVSIDTIRDGIVVSGFDAWDALGFRQQLGFIPED